MLSEYVAYHWVELKPDGMNELIILTKSQFVELIDERLSTVVEEKLGHLKKERKRHPEKKLLSTSQACEYLGVSKSTLQRYRNNGEIRHHKIGGKIVYHIDDILELVGR